MKFACIWIPRLTLFLKNEKLLEKWLCEFQYPCFWLYRLKGIFVLISNDACTWMLKSFNSHHFAFSKCRLPSPFSDSGYSQIFQVCSLPIMIKRLSNGSVLFRGIPGISSVMWELAYSILSLLFMTCLFLLHHLLSFHYIISNPCREWITKNWYRNSHSQCKVWEKCEEKFWNN